MGTRFTPLASHFPRERPLGALPQTYNGLASSADPCRGGHQITPATQSTQRGRGLWPARPPASRTEKAAAVEAAAPSARKRGPRPAPRGKRGALRPRAPPSSDALTSTAFPTGPASAAISGLQPHLHKLLFPSPGLGKQRRRVRRPGHGSAPQPAGSPPPAPATSRSSRGSFRCLRGSRRRLGSRGRAGRGGAERRARPTLGAWPRCRGPGEEIQACPHL